MTVQLSLGHSTVRLDPHHPNVLLGRDEHAAGLACPDPSVSRRHAEVCLQNGRTYIRDLGSSNGTWAGGAAVGREWVELAPGQQVFVGHVPLLVQWESAGAGQNATVMGEIPPEIQAMIAARRQQAQVQVSAPPPRAGGSAPAELNYRRQGSNDNGVLLIALPGDSFTNDSTLQGFAEFTAMDAEKVNEITVELVEIHRKGAKKGHVWDRVLVKKGPWKCKRDDRVPMPFQLRVPSATSISGKNVQWEIRGVVDIAWAFDIEVDVPISMRNQDVERIRDALGLLDFRVVELESKPLGQQFDGKFHPPANWANQMNIDAINLQMQYLGTNLEVLLEVDKRGMFSSDKRTKVMFDLQQLRATSVQQLAQQLHQSIQHMLQLT